MSDMPTICEWCKNNIDSIAGVDGYFTDENEPILLHQQCYQLLLEIAGEDE